MRAPAPACLEAGRIEILPASFHPVARIPKTIGEFNELGTYWAPLIAVDYLEAYAKAARNRLRRKV